MGMYDTVMVPCPKCGERFPAQSKSGDCTLETFKLEDAPEDVLCDVNRHAPFSCDSCGTLFKVQILFNRVTEPVSGREGLPDPSEN